MLKNEEKTESTRKDKARSPYIDKELYNKVRLHCIQYGVPITKFVEDALNEHLSRVEKNH